MAFIEESFNVLIKHCINNGLEVKEKDFALINSISDTPNDKKINLFLMGVFLNREKTPKIKVYRERDKYRLEKNFFEVYFSMTFPSLEEYSQVLRILCDFEEDSEKNRFRLLNSSQDFKSSLLIEPFLNLKNDKGVSNRANAVFVRVEKSVETLQTAPERKLVKEVKIQQTIEHKGKWVEFKKEEDSKKSKKGKK